MSVSTRIELVDGWEMARVQPGLPADDALCWSPARVPGTVAGALGAADADIDAYDWWFRTRFAAEPAGDGEQVLLRLGGLATLAEVYLNGELILESGSMYTTHELDISAGLEGRNELAICLRALMPRLRQRRKPRARWRTKLVAEGNLRFHRTMLLGRAPSFSPPAPVIGPWRPVVLERRRGTVATGVRLRTRLDGNHGLLSCGVAVRALGDEPVPEFVDLTVAGPTGVVATSRLAVDPVSGRAAGSVRVPGVDPWWPHTHGRPSLYEVRLAAGDQDLHRASVGFRRLQAASDLLADGPALRINDVPVFARGAVWTPLDLRAPHADKAALRDVLERVVAGGMNMLRVPGIGAYESDAFYDLCDELGILVWQDFMFANLDYPEQDPEFLDVVAAEARSLLERLGRRPSLAVLCGGSEVAQQVAMLGLDPRLAEGPLYGQLLPDIVQEAGVDAAYLPSTPWGGDLPFRTDRGVANYYGVGAYLRPLEDARRAEVRFAGESLAFANVPDDAALSALHTPGGLSVNHPGWKAGVPRDAGAGWDFDDVRDHYLGELFGVDPVALRSVEQERYLQLSRMVTGELMAETFGEWRRAASPCGGALVLWLKDLVPGAGWGVLDHRGLPKVAYHHLRRALAPVAVWSTDEGLGGLAVHIANDGPEPVAARLRVALYRDHEVLVDEAFDELELPAHSQLSRGVEALLGRFADVTWAYRFGPPAQDLVALSLERRSEGDLLSQSFRFPVARPLARLSDEALGLRATAERTDQGTYVVRVASRRFAYGVRVELPGCVPADDAFGVEPGHERVIELLGSPYGSPGAVTAVNLIGSVRLAPG
jgi:beta-mannosidase